jgi:uncharacterized protein (DUF488 family)
VTTVKGKSDLSSQGNKVIYSAGTSIREKKQFIKLLKEFNVEAVADVRRFAKSRFDYFCKDELCSMLKENKIGYVYLGDTLGGFREKGYQEYTRTEDFHQGLDELKKVASKKRTAFMCAERFPWRCHRRFIAQELVKEGWRVIHIIYEGKIWEAKAKNQNQRKKKKSISLSLPI